MLAARMASTASAAAIIAGELRDDDKDDNGDDAWTAPAAACGGDNGNDGCWPADKTCPDPDPDPELRRLLRRGRATIPASMDDVAAVPDAGSEEDPKSEAEADPLRRPRRVAVGGGGVSRDTAAGLEPGDCDRHPKSLVLSSTSLSKNDDDDDDDAREALRSSVPRLSSLPPLSLRSDPAWGTPDA
jgi:hypothetical protein